MPGFVSASMKGNAEMSAGYQVNKDGSWQLYLPREGTYDLRYGVEGVSRTMVFNTVPVVKGQTIEEIVIRHDPSTTAPTTAGTLRLQSR
jgi:hypothetical protein